MLTNKQKIVFSVFSFVSILVAILVVLPFDILVDRLNLQVENILTIELIYKLICLPLISIGITICAMVIRKKIYNEQLDVSVAAIKMSYMPVAVYLGSLLAWFGGVLHSSTPFETDIYSLFMITFSWILSAVIIFMFGVFLMWQYKLSSKKFTIINIIYLICTVGIIVGVFLGIKDIKTIEPIKMENAYVKLVLFISVYAIVLVCYWKSLASEDVMPVVLSKDEEFTEEEKEILIISKIDEDISEKFEGYYIENKTKYFDRIIEGNENPEKGGTK